MSIRRTLPELEGSALKVLVTGAGGTIGRRLLPMLQAAGHRVLAASRRLPAGATSDTAIVGDLLDDALRARVTSALRDDNGGASAIVHLAAESDIAAASGRPDALFRTNVLLTQLMLESAAEAGASRFIFASSGYVYGTSHSAAFSETNVPCPQRIYSASKLAAEALVQGYSAECGFAGTSIRISNVYGPDSPPSTVAGRIIDQLRRRQPVDVATRLPVRDFIFVDDVADAIRALLATPASAAASVLNVSTGIGTSVGALVDTAVAAANGSVFQPAAPDPTSADRLVLNNKRICELAGWSPQRRLLDGLRLCFAATTPGAPRVTSPGH